MKKLFIVLLFIVCLVGCGSPAPAAVLVFSPNGTYTVKTNLATAATAADVAGKTVVVTSPQVVTAAIAWPSDRTLKFETRGYVTFTGAGALTNLTEARPEWFGANLTNAATATLALQKAVAASLHVIIGKSLPISGTIVPRSYQTIEFKNGAVLNVVANNVTVFQTTGETYGVHIIYPNIDATGFTGVTGFDLIRFKVNSIIDHPILTNITNGIILRQLSHDCVIESPRIQVATNPILIMDGSAGVQIRHPSIESFTGIGIQIDDGPTYQTLSVSIEGGFIQSGGTGNIGIQDSGWSTRIHGTYFETNNVADIYENGSYQFDIEATSHFASGVVAIKGRNCKGGAIRDPIMGSGVRSTGLFDFDGTNERVYAWYLSPPTSSTNQPVGVVSGITMENSSTLASLAWTPVFSNLTIVPGNGGVAVAGKYSIVGNIIYWTCTLTVTGTATHAYVAGSSISGLLNGLPGIASAITASATPANLGIGYNTGGGQVYMAGWSATNSTAVISGSYNIN